MDDRGRVKAEEIGKRIGHREKTGLAQRRKGAKRERLNTEKRIEELPEVRGQWSGIRDLEGKEMGKRTGRDGGR